MHRVHVIVSEPGNDQDQPVGISQVNLIFVQDDGMRKGTALCCAWRGTGLGMHVICACWESRSSHVSRMARPDMYEYCTGGAQVYMYTVAHRSALTRHFFDHLTVPGGPAPVLLATCLVPGPAAVHSRVQ
jgi:hypothetical protein